jgi:hypothetical protein
MTAIGIPHEVRPLYTYLYGKVSRTRYRHANDVQTIGFRLRKITPHTVQNPFTWIA